MKLILITLFSSVTMPPTESTTPSPGIIAASVISVLVAIAVVGTIAIFLVRSSSAYKKWLSYSSRDCEQHNGFKLESQEQVKVEPLQTSALETPPQHIPKWMKPVATLTDCTSDGRSYYDEYNDFRLEIPEGAIPEGERVIIDIAVALYGPFQYPECLRPVSPVFWVCVRGRETFRFLKPVKSTIEHCLRLGTDTDTHSLGLTFLKGDHSESTNQKYLLQRLQGDEKCEFIANDNHAVLHTNHFCYQCIASKVTKEFIYSANFAFLVFTPIEMVYSKPVPIYFFAIFLLEACVKTIEEQMEKQKEGKIFYSTTLPFRFPKGKDNPVIKLQWENILPGGWSIESRNVIEVYI